MCHSEDGYTYKRHQVDFEHLLDTHEVKCKRCGFVKYKLTTGGIAWRNPSDVNLSKENNDNAGTTITT